MGWSLSSTSLGSDDKYPETGQPSQLRSYWEEGEGGFKLNRVKVRVKRHSRCSLEPQAHSATPSAQCIPALRPEGAGPGDLGEVALRRKGHRSGVKGHSLSPPSFHPLPLTPLVFGLHCAACGILVPGMGVEPRGTAVRVESWPLSCWGSCPSFIAAALKRVSGAKG